MKQAMTYLEMILALIIISIVVSISYPKYDDDRLEVAADELIIKMKYISYLATLQDNFDVEDEYFRAKLWQIRFHTIVDKENVIAYSIFKDTDGNGNMDLYKSNKDEFLFDAIANKEIRATKYRFDTKKLRNKSSFLDKMYGVDGIEFPEDCKIGASRKLMFDRYGQVYTRYKRIDLLKGTQFLTSKLYPATCPTYKLTLKQGNKKVGICIETSTSYIYKCQA